VLTLAIVFFIAYWLVAGPGVFFYLVGRRRTQVSWFAFAASALVATGLTVLLVKLVLRGPPELQHFTVVRAAPDVPAVVNSRMGLYIPRDGMQEVELRDVAPNSVTTLSAFAEHPARIRPDAREKQGPEYYVPVVDASQNEPAKVSVPYRSTLKKLQATWVGELKGKVEGSATLLDTGFIEGKLTNGTGKLLTNVYFAFAFPGETMDAGTWMLYVPRWEDGATLDLNREFNRAGTDGKTDTAWVSRDTGPDGRRNLRGKIERDWVDYWYRGMRARMMETNYDDWFETGARRSLPVLSFFERLPPVDNESNRTDRTELIRRRARELDVSHALGAGALVVLAESQGPLPFPMEVEGDPVTGTGVTLYQFLLPLDRSKLSMTTIKGEENATTEPTESTESTEKEENR
jgi:hypothetical protein